MVVETAAEDDGDELMLDSSDSDDCVGVTDAAWSLELGVYELIETVELALLCASIKIPTTIPFRPGMGACGASLR